MSFDLDYIKAWADASAKGKSTFFAQGKNHNTKGGTIIV
jgi:hypothetical protein